MTTTPRTDEAIAASDYMWPDDAEEECRQLETELAEANVKAAKWEQMADRLAACMEKYDLPDDADAPEAYQLALSEYNQLKGQNK